MTNPKVSVIMCAYNGEEYIEESIDSILAQTLTDFEMIIVDDGSNDSTKKIIQKYQDMDKRVVFLSNNENMGICFTLNKGLDSAKGDFIAILDNDDIALPDRLQIQYDYLKSNPKTFLLGGSAILINETGAIIGKTKPILGKESVEKKLPNANCIYHPTVMYRKTNLRYRNKLVPAMDYDFYLLALSQGLHLDNISSTLIKYRVRSGSVSKSKGGIMALVANQASIFYKERAKNSGKDSYDKFKPNSFNNILIPTKNKIYVIGEIESLLKTGLYNEVLVIIKKQTKSLFIQPEYLFYLLISVRNGFGHKLLKSFKKTLQQR